jgi:hypothetical protein
VIRPGTGRDPLGLSLISDRLTSLLLPGIISTTERARYYSFYTWAISEIETMRKAGGQKVSFEHELQWREAAFALASKLEFKTSLSVIGSDAVKVTLSEERADGTLDTHFRVLPANPTGGFAQYYSACLQNLRLIKQTDWDQWEVESDGKEIATAFSGATRHASYFEQGWASQRYVPRSVLQKSANVFSLDSIDSQAASKERQLLIEALFSLDQKPTPKDPLYRQGTLGELLHVINAYERAGLALTRRRADQMAIIWPHYFESLDAGKGEAQVYEVSAAFREEHACWRQYAAHQFLIFALEELFGAVLDKLAAHRSGLDQTSLLDALLDDAFLTDLKLTMGRDCARPEILLYTLGMNGVPDAAISRSLTQSFGIKNPLNEWTLCLRATGTPKTRLGRALLTLALLYGKWRRCDGDDNALLVVERIAGDTVCLSTIFGWFDSWLTEALDWRSAIGRLLGWLIERQDEVKFRKFQVGKFDASWLEVDNGRFIRLRDVESHFRSSRHGSALTILQDLGLLRHSKQDEQLRLTEAGGQVLEKVILVRS